MKYPHSCVITRTAKTISTAGGVPVDGTTSQIYNGKCDAQENSRTFNVQAGLVTTKGSATVFLPDGKVQSKRVSTGDSVTITWNDGSTQAGRVENPSNLDDTFLVQYS